MPDSVTSLARNIPRTYHGLITRTNSLGGRKLAVERNRDSHEIEQLRAACDQARERWIGVHAAWDDGQASRQEVRAATEDYEKALEALDGGLWN